MLNIVFIAVIVLAGLLVAKTALAVCPICTIAVVGGIELSHLLGIDDTVTGLWVGGLTVSLIIWTINWLNKKNIRFLFRKILTVIVYYGLIVVPLYFIKMIGANPFNVFWGVDKLFLGIIFGSVGFFAGVSWYEYLKKKNGGHAHFHFQKVVMPITPLVVLSFIFYFLTK
ncbi:MAG: hypothetical protein NTZ18_02860 [Candidatus Komeilibacteria bacterium]|nr:hypothetical protein [Candidatus Komeilibacteria bacterium]